MLPKITAFPGLKQESISEKGFMKGKNAMITNGIYHIYKYKDRIQFVDQNSYRTSKTSHERWCPSCNCTGTTERDMNIKMIGSTYIKSLFQTQCTQTLLHPNWRGLYRPLLISINCKKSEMNNLILGPLMGIRQA